MAAGPKQHYIEFRERIVSGKNSFGEATEDWTTVAFTAWAEAQNFGSREFRAIERVYAESTIRFRLYWRAEAEAITDGVPFHANHQIYFKGKFWKIQPAIPDNNGREMTIEASVIE